jgi:hypothetical protein
MYQVFVTTSGPKRRIYKWSKIVMWENEKVEKVVYVRRLEMIVFQIKLFTFKCE